MTGQDHAAFDLALRFADADDVAGFLFLEERVKIFLIQNEFADHGGQGGPNEAERAVRCGFFLFERGEKVESGGPDEQAAGNRNEGHEGVRMDLVGFPGHGVGHGLQDVHEVLLGFGFPGFPAGARPNVLADVVDFFAGVVPEGGQLLFVVLHEGFGFHVLTFLSSGYSSASGSL